MSQKPKPIAPPPAEKPKRVRIFFMHRLSKLLFKLVVLLLALCAVLLAWNYVQEKTFALKNPITEKAELSDTTVKRKLQSIGQLVTYSYDYDNVREIKNSKQLFGYSIPGTAHTIQLKYSGTIKVGYEVESIGIRVDNNTGIIYITLPEPEVTDNYIDTDNLSYAEQNNIFNPISGEEITKGMESIMQEELANAEQAGIYDLAAGNAKALISGLLSEFAGFAVRFN